MSGPQINPETPTIAGLPFDPRLAGDLLALLEAPLASHEVPVWNLALDYADFGLPVFPCHPVDVLFSAAERAQREAAARAKAAQTGEPYKAPSPIRNTCKSPMTPRGHHDATTDSRAASRMFPHEILPHRLVGIPVAGLKALYLDFDRHGKREDGSEVDGVRNGAALLAAWGIWPTVWAKSAGGGVHILLTVPADVDFGTRVPAEWAGLGIDVRGPTLTGKGGGYMIAAGSMLPDGREWKANDIKSYAIGLKTGACLPMMPSGMADLWRKLSRERAGSIHHPDILAEMGEDGFPTGSAGWDGRNALAELCATIAPNAAGPNDNDSWRAARAGAMVRAGLVAEWKAFDVLLSASAGRDTEKAARTIKRQMEWGETEAEDWIVKSPPRPLDLIWNCPVREPTEAEIVAARVVERDRATAAPAAAFAPPTFTAAIAEDGQITDSITGEVIVPSSDLTDFGVRLRDRIIPAPGGAGSLINQIAWYLEHSTVDADPLMCLQGALTICAAVASRRVTNPTGTNPHLFVLGIKEQGSGKAAAVDQAKRILDEAGLGHLALGEAASGEGLFRVMDSHERVRLMSSDEFAPTLIRALQHGGPNPNSGTLSARLRSLWNSRGEVFRGHTASGEGGSLDRTALTISATIQPSSLGALMDSDFVGSGLAGRFLVFDASSHEPPTPVSEIDPDAPVDMSKRKNFLPRVPTNIARGLRMMATEDRFAAPRWSIITRFGAECMEGEPGNWSRPEQMVKDLPEGARLPTCFDELMVGWADAETEALFYSFKGWEGRVKTSTDPRSGTIARVAEMALRLATVSARSRGDVEITKDDLSFGIYYSLAANADFTNFVKQYESGDQFDQARNVVLDALRKAPKFMLPRSKLLRLPTVGRDAAKIFGILVEAGLIRVASNAERTPRLRSVTAGRPSVVYVLTGQTGDAAATTLALPSVVANALDAWAAGADAVAPMTSIEFIASLWAAHDAKKAAAMVNPSLATAPPITFGNATPTIPGWVVTPPPAPVPQVAPVVYQPPPAPVPPAPLPQEAPDLMARMLAAAPAPVAPAPPAPRHVRPTPGAFGLFGVVVVVAEPVDPKIAIREAARFGRASAKWRDRCRMRDVAQLQPCRRIAEASRRVIVEKPKAPKKEAGPKVSKAQAPHVITPIQQTEASKIHLAKWGSTKTYTRLNGPTQEQLKRLAASRLAEIHQQTEPGLPPWRPPVVHPVPLDQLIASFARSPVVEWRPPNIRPPRYRSPDFGPPRYRSPDFGQTGALSSALEDDDIPF